MAERATKGFFRRPRLHNRTPWFSRALFPASGPSDLTTVVLLVLINDVVNDAVLFGLLCVHYKVTLNVFFHLFQLLSGVLGNELAGDFPHTQDLSSMYINICGLAPNARHQGLVNKNPRSG